MKIQFHKLRKMKEKWIKCKEIRYSNLITSFLNGSLEEKRRKKYHKHSKYSGRNMIESTKQSKPNKMNLMTLKDNLKRQVKKKYM